MLPSEPNRKIQRVAFELRADGINSEQQQTNPLRSGVHSRGYLPHVKREGARYFVTFRLADSLPTQVLFRIQAERAAALRQLDRVASNQIDHTLVPKSQAFREVERAHFRKIEQFLDRGHGQCWLKRDDMAQLVSDALRFFEGERYRLNAWVVMPNHVHVVFWPSPNHTVSEILKSWKGHTAREANKLLRRTGQAFWQPEPFDHWIRGDEEHARCCSYVIYNPVKARLCARPEQWRWSSAWNETLAK